MAPASPPGALGAPGGAGGGLGASLGASLVGGGAQAASAALSSSRPGTAGGALAAGAGAAGASAPAGVVGSVGSVVPGLSELFAADPVWGEVYIACCCDVREAPTLEAARGFRDALLTQNPDTKTDRLSARALRLGPTTVSCMGLQLKDRGYTRLDLSQNQLGDHAALSVRSLVRALPKLKQLHLAGNVLSSAGAQEIAEELEVNSTLEVLALGGRRGEMQQAGRGFRPNAIGTDGLASLLGALSRNKNPSLTSLNLCQTALSAESGKHIASFLERDRTLLHLDLSCNPLASQGVCSLLPHCSRLRLLDIGDTGCRGELVHLQLAALLQSTTSLMRLSLARNMLEPRPLRRIGRAIAGCQSLVSLSLEGTDMGTEGITLLVEALLDAEVPTLTDLDLSSNALSQVEAASALAHLLAKYTTLHTLRLGHNALGDAGIIELVSALDGDACPDCSLHTLELGTCRIGTAGASHLLGQLANNEHLRVLRLADNFLDDGLDMKALENLKNLRELQLCGNRLSHAMLQRAAQAVAKNRQTMRDKEPSTLRSEVNRMLFQETKLSAAKEQVRLDSAEVAEREAATSHALRELQNLREDEAEARHQLSKRLQFEEMELEAVKERRELATKSLADATRSFAHRQAELKERLRQRETELADMQVTSDATERRLESRKKEHPLELKRLEERAKAATEEAAQFQEQARVMRQQLKKLQDKGLVDFKP